MSDGERAASRSPSFSRRNRLMRSSPRWRSAWPPPPPRRIGCAVRWHGRRRDPVHRRLRGRQLVRLVNFRRQLVGRPAAPTGSRAPAPTPSPGRHDVLDRTTPCRPRVTPDRVQRQSTRSAGIAARAQSTTNFYSLVLVASGSARAAPHLRRRRDHAGASAATAVTPGTWPTRCAGRVTARRCAARSTGRSSSPPRTAPSPRAGSAWSRPTPARLRRRQVFTGAAPSTPPDAAATVVARSPHELRRRPPTPRRAGRRLRHGERAGPERHHRRRGRPDRHRHHGGRAERLCRAAGARTSSWSRGPSRSAT